MTELTSTAKKIMEVFRYFRIKKDDYLSVKLVLSRRYLWQDIDDQTFNDALNELILRGYVGAMEEPLGWRLLEQGAEYINQLERQSR
jgi:hypothetical protein